MHATLLTVFQYLGRKYTEIDYCKGEDTHGIFLSNVAINVQPEETQNPRPI